MPKRYREATPSEMRPCRPNSDPPEPDDPGDHLTLDAPAASPCGHIPPGTPRLTHAALLDALLADHWHPWTFSDTAQILHISQADLEDRTRYATCERCTSNYGHALHYGSPTHNASTVYLLCHRCGHCTRIA